jgi:hydroxypyruvate isomerase
MKLDELCAAGAGMGLKSVELLHPDEWETTKEARAGVRGRELREVKPDSEGAQPCRESRRHREGARGAAASGEGRGIPNQICFSGNRDGMDDKQG